MYFQVANKKQRDTAEADAEMKAKREAASKQGDSAVSTEYGGVVNMLGGGDDDDDVIF